MSEASTSSAGRFSPLAAVFAWALPGLGHAVLGEWGRGLILFVAIFGLYVGGLLIGGIGVIDSLQPLESPEQERREVSLWYFGQILVGPSVIIKEYHQRYMEPDLGVAMMTPINQPEPTYYEPSFGRVFEHGQLFTALAGLLNLLAILDVINWDPERRRILSERRERRRQGLAELPEHGDAEATVPAPTEAAAVAISSDEAAVDRHEKNDSPRGEALP